eukprot:1668727-Rhodomonas_salina.1
MRAGTSQICVPKVKCAFGHAECVPRTVCVDAEKSTMLRNSQPGVEINQPCASSERKKQRKQKVCLLVRAWCDIWRGVPGGGARGAGVPRRCPARPPPGRSGGGGGAAAERRAAGSCVEAEARDGRCD